VLLYSLDGSAYTTIAPPILKVDGTDDGAHTVSIEERDTAGNISGASSLTFTLDTQAPATPAAPVLVNDTATAGDKITSDPTVTYPTPTAGDVLLYSTDGINFTTTAPTFATNGTADVSHTVSIEEEDTAGKHQRHIEPQLHARYAGAGHAGRAGTSQRHRDVEQRQDHQQLCDHLPDAGRGRRVALQPRRQRLHDDRAADIEDRRNGRWRAHCVDRGARHRRATSAVRRA